MVPLGLLTLKVDAALSRVNLRIARLKQARDPGCSTIKHKTERKSSDNALCEHLRDIFVAFG